MSCKIAAMHLSNFLKHVEEGCLVITPGDRGDALTGRAFRPSRKDEGQIEFGRGEGPGAAVLETEKAAAIESLRVAIRDTELKMAAELKTNFAAHVRRLVSGEMSDKKFLQQVILAIAGMAAGDQVGEDKPVEVLLPSELFETDKKRTELTEKGQERMRHLVLGISGDMLREGVDLIPSEDISGGVRICLVGEDLEIDLSDQAISDLLLQNLLPRYVAIVTGTE